LDGGRKEIKVDFHSEFGSYSRDATSHQSSRTSEHSGQVLQMQIMTEYSDFVVLLLFFLLSTL
jgi:hypothetical protein